MNKNPAIQNFKKYDQDGAYHWLTVKPSIKTTFNPYLEARYSVALSAIEKAHNSGNVAVDLGCGDGYVSHRLAELGYRVFGVDGSERAIELARKQMTKDNRAITLSVGNVCDTNLKSDLADLIVSLDVIEHLDNVETFLKEIRRIARPGAKVLIGTPIRFTERPLDKYHVKEFYADEFKTLLSSHFEVLEVKKTHPIEYVALMQKKFRLLGKEKSLGWNLINLVFKLTGKNLLATSDSRFPTYQFAVCRVAKT